MATITTLIRHDEIIAEMASERCHHFTKGGCRSCDIEVKAAKISQKLAILAEACDEEFEANGYSKKFNELLDEYNQLDCDLHELSHP